MNLQGRSILDHFNDYEAFDKLNCEAFPPEERIETAKLMRMAGKGELDITALYDGDVFVGFISLVVEAPTAYIFFLAVDKEKRSQGYGSQALSLLSKMYPDYQIVLDLEEVDEAAGNIRQRIIRKKFYLRNGYRETGYFLYYNHMMFEVLCNKARFDYEDFLILLDKLNSFGITTIQIRRRK